MSADSRVRVGAVLFQEEVSAFRDVVAPRPEVCEVEVVAEAAWRLLGKVQGQAAGTI